LNPLSFVFILSSYFPINFLNQLKHNIKIKKGFQRQIENLF